MQSLVNREKDVTLAINDSETLGPESEGTGF